MASFPAIVLPKEVGNGYIVLAMMALDFLPGPRPLYQPGPLAMALALDALKMACKS
jgi:hypothetical protein